MQAGFAQQQMFNPVQGQGGVQSNQYAQPGASGQPSVPYNGNHMVNYPPPQQQQQQPFLQGNQGHCQPQGFYHAGGGGYQQPTPATPHNYVNQDYQQMPVLQQPGTTATPQQPGATATSQQPDPTATPQQPDATTPQSTGTKTEDKDHTGFRVALSSLFSNQNKSEREAAATKQNQKATPETTEQGQKTVPASTEQGQKTVPASTEQGLKTVPASTGQGLETVPASTGQGLETVPA
nr:hypothetical protein [Endozoicomonas sp.]